MKFRWYSQQETADQSKQERDPFTDLRRYLTYFV